ncbi:alpha/beta hydrolase [Apibacter muscae]|uniref:Alpha/beta hydrolase n=1 Tax=Apibacter muscae TaxID=2509004 RepID=A0A563DFP1_9FLAO|nr:alpha/beta hydrolase [Apibacter muscae]TWP23759.1 alpha/beta hydrolase [Apibacter muscae]TWP29045.1 alpha/beta hydrolase [Apibacter muscae]TWP30374.1 alpha/beta hydrolase [Apibacter muscae]
MIFSLPKKNKFIYTEVGEGSPIVLLHGLMGGLSNFKYQIEYFSQKGYKVYFLQLPLYTLPQLKTNISGLTNYVIKFLEKVVDKPAILIGNSLGGHLGLITSLKKAQYVKALVLTGSSGLYERSFGDSYPKRGSYEYIKKKAQDVFYDPDIATKELVDEVYETVTDRLKAIKTIQIARSAMKNNLSEELKNIKIPTCLIWGKQDNVTPPEVAEEFNQFIPDSKLYWVDKCGHSPMMEKPEEFNSILYEWLKSREL